MIKERADALSRGEAKYQPSKPCKRGHTSPRNTATGHCAECLADGQRARIAANPGKHRAACKRWSDANPGKTHGYSEKWNNENPERRLEIARLWRERNPERSKEIQLAHYYRNRADKIAYVKKWRGENPERYKGQQRAWVSINLSLMRAHAAERNARKRTATCKFGQGGVKYLYKMAKDLGLSVDHIVPLKHDLVCGLHNIYNMQLMPLERNVRKSNTFEVAPCI